MRIRYLKNTPQILAGSSYYLEDDEAILRRGRWRESLSQTPQAESQPGGWVTLPRLEMEIGSGRGQYLTTLAGLNPNTLFLGVEKSLTVLARSIKKLDEEETLPNVKLLGLDALKLAEAFCEGEVDRLYLNFSDPWPKLKHEKRRLTAPAFLAVYQKILSPAGDLCLKTDNPDFFDFSRSMLTEAGWQILTETRDLYEGRNMAKVMEQASSLQDYETAKANPADPNPERFIRTEYETAFLKNGKKIHYLRALPASAKSVELS